MAVAGFAFGENEAALLESTEETSVLAQRVEGTLDGKSLKSIYIEAGIIKPSATQGGRRAGAGRPPKGHDLAAELRELDESPAENLAIANEIFPRLMEWAIRERGFERLPAKALPQILASLRELTAEVNRVLGS